MKHTPGPWWVDDDGFVAAGYGDSYETVADPHCSIEDIDEREENARLIAAAPELLEALVGMVEVFGDQPHILTLNEVVEAKRIIARTKGD